MMNAAGVGSLAICSVLLVASAALAQEKDSRLYEMRTYHAAPGKLEALEARFRDHTVKLFEKHGMTNIGYWVPLDNPDNKLIYILAYPSRKASAASWRAFSADPEWQKVRKDSEAKGRLVTRVEQRYMTATDYSPAVKPGHDTERVFELRIYTASKGNLANLNARFRDHTLKLFAKHGMTSIGYWAPVPMPNVADDTLIYILAHKSVEAAKASFDAFRKDPDWIAARTASEQAAGGPLTVKDGVKSIFMKATDFSPIR
jgi:hypothetical protein